jgi:hypothetical protein
VALVNPRLASGDAGIGLNVRRMRDGFLGAMTVVYYLEPLEWCGGRGVIENMHSPTLRGRNSFACVRRQHAVALPPGERRSRVYMEAPGLTLAPVIE